jgi:DNA-binding response OmpR family regulator
MNELTLKTHQKIPENNSKKVDSILEKQKQNELHFASFEKPHHKRILIVDDEPDIAYTLKLALENSNKRFRVEMYNNPITVLSEFKPNYYELLLIDINMPFMNGFELCEKILQLDLNVRICFMSTGEINLYALRDVYPKISMGCFIKKPTMIDNLVKIVEAELE